jgi:fibro-slime domain-containing protein
MRELNLKSSAMLTRWAALPLVLAAVGCGGSSNDSQIGDFGVSAAGRAGGGGPDLMVPTPGSGAGAGNNGSGGAGGVEPGTYQLPADFTPATLGGFKLGAPIEPSMAGAGAPGAGGTTGCGTSILGVVRDFKGANEPGGHGDFEAFNGSSASKGIVHAMLGADQKPVYTAMGAFIDPQNGQQTTTKAAFDQWYRATPDVNKPYVIYFYFQPNANVLTFQSNAFYPLDGKGWGNTCTEAGAHCNKQDHNFGFTTELHTQFNYKGGETFSFTGDDDLWVFINHQLAIDLGGLHSSKSDTVSLDMAATKLGISIGGTYDLDLFHAERHTNASNFRVDTNLAFTNCGTIVEEPPVK